MKISVYIAAAANGLISNSRNVPDWLSPEYGQGFASICQKTKAVIMGKTTYNILAPNYLPLSLEGRTVVLTSNPDAKSENNTVMFTNKRANQIIEMLEKEGYTEAVIIGGTQTISTFFEAGLVDELIFVIEPVLFGSGLPFLNTMALENKLLLQSIEKLNMNTVQLHYKIVKQGK